MNYIIFDLELNSKPFKNRHPNEIVEIGAIKLDESLNYIDEFQAFAKPKIYQKLFKVVRNKTNISQSDINSAEDLKKVISEFRQWAGSDSIFCSWGHDDIHHLKTNCSFNKISSKWLMACVDIQKQCSKIFDLPKGQAFSLKNALEMLEIPLNEELHRADTDARYTAEIFKKLFDRLDFTSMNAVNKDKPV